MLGRENTLTDKELTKQGHWAAELTGKVDALCPEQSNLWSRGNTIIQK